MHKRFGRSRLRNFPIISFFHYYVYFRHIRRMEIVEPLNFIPYDKQSAIAFLEKSFGWRYYGGKHYESRWTRFYQAYYLPEKFGYDKRKAHLASLVIAGQMTRADALNELEKPLYTDNELAEDKAFVAKKLGLTVEELEDLVHQPPRYYSEFPTNAWQLKWGLRVLGAWRRLTRVPFASRAADAWRNGRRSGLDGVEKTAKHRQIGAPP